MNRSQICKSCADTFSLRSKRDAISWVDICHWCNQIKEVREVGLRFLFLDIDGVLNRHKRHSNGVCGIERECVSNLNHILKTCPDVLIVVSSSWRYYVHNGFMTMEGFGLMLQTHGVACYKRIHGITEHDGQHPLSLNGRGWDEITPEEKDAVHDWGVLERARQVRAYANNHDCEQFVVLDDIDLGLPELVKTDSKIGLTAELAGKAIKRFRSGDAK